MFHVLRCGWGRLRFACSPYHTTASKHIDANFPSAVRLLIAPVVQTLAPCPGGRRDARALCHWPKLRLSWRGERTAKGNSSARRRPRSNIPPSARCHRRRQRHRQPQLPRPPPSATGCRAPSRPVARPVRLVLHSRRKAWWCSVRGWPASAAAPQPLGPFASTTLVSGSRCLHLRLRLHPPRPRHDTHRRQSPLPNHPRPEAAFAARPHHGVARRLSRVSSGPG